MRCGSKGVRRDGKSLLGITKSGSSVKGEMRLVPKPDGTCGGLEPNKRCQLVSPALAVAVRSPQKEKPSGECVGDEPSILIPIQRIGTSGIQ